MGDVILGLVVGLALSSILAGIWMGASGDEELSIGGKAFSQMGLWIGLVGSPLLATRRKGSGSLTVDFGWAARKVDLALGVAVGIGAQLVIVPGVALLLRPLLGHPEVSRPVKDLVAEANGAALVGLDPDRGGGRAPRGGAVLPGPAPAVDREAPRTGVGDRGVVGVLRPGPPPGPGVQGVRP